MSEMNTPEQEAVITASADADVLVVAGAGSGKTYTMTERVIALITNPTVRKRVGANEILGLTFTNKAAQELQSRVGQRVAQELGGSDSRISRIEALTMRPDVMTYDAFFQQIVRQYGLLIGVDQSVAPLSEAGRYELAAQVVSDSMADIFSGSEVQEGEEDSESAQAFRSGGDDAEQPVSRFEALVREILQISDECLSYMIDETHPDFDSAVRAAQEWNDAFISKVSKLIDEATAGDPEATAVLAEVDEPGVKTRSRKPEKRLPEIEVKVHQRAIWRANHLLTVAKKRRMLLHLAKRYDELKRANHFAEFADFTVYALQLLTRFPSIGQEYRRRYTHIFLDEYQDTSTTQAKLIARLFHPVHSEDSEGAPHEGNSSVTAVGDPFQSIYAWRGASPGAFTLFRDDFDLTHVEPSPLTFSVRNPQTVLALANALTVPLRDKRLLTRKGTLSSSQVSEVDVDRLNVLDTPQRRSERGSVAVMGYASRTQEAAALARFAKKYSEKYREESETPVAILVRSKAHMADYGAALEAAGLSYELVGFSDLMSQPEIQDLFALLDSVTDHTNAAAMMRLLASPRFGFSGKQLRSFAEAAEQLNQEQQYSALVAAGFATGKENLEEQARLVHDHRDAVPNLVTLIDVLLDEEVEKKLVRFPRVADRRLDASAVKRVKTFSRLLRRVEAASNTNVSRALHEAVEALDLDIDLVVSSAMAQREPSVVTRSEVGSRLDAIVQMVDTYTTELPVGISPSLRGFVEWIEALEKDPEESAQATQHRPDVVVMTVHQAKGLGWKAVAVAGMTSSVFPSSKSVTVSEDLHAGGEPSRRNLHFRAVASSWVENAASLPVPVRTDAKVLPRFPHSAIPGNPLASLDLIDSVDALSSEIYETDEAQEEIGQNVDYLSLREEYGSRAHADERRLAYVAVTRSKEVALLTFSAHQRATKPEAGIFRTDIRPQEAGVFWNDAADFVAQQGDAVKIGLEEDAWRDAEGIRRQMCGAIWGQDTTTLSDILMDQTLEITEEDLDAEAGKTRVDTSAWPLTLEEPIEAALSLSAEAVKAAMREDSVAGIDSTREPVSESSDDSLLARAQLVVAHDGLSNAVSTDSADSGARELDELQERVAAVLPKVSLGATQIQRLASTDQLRNELVGILRPLPGPPNFAADLGTRFHAWAQELLGDEGVDSLLEKPEDDADGRKLAVWQQRFMESEWAHRPVKEIESAYVVDLFGLRVVARLDAVFHGWYRNIPGDAKGLYTIVDWKTGRKPVSEQDRQRAQLQLDLYRLVLSRNLGIDVGGIDACLYYIDQSDAEQRTIFADMTQSANDILAHLQANSAILRHLAHASDASD